MNPAAGGPVGGGMMMMNNGSPAVNAGMNSSDPMRMSLNTYIYDYLLKNGHFEIARSITRDDKFEFQQGPKTSPGRRKDGEINGDGGDGMDMDQKDDVPDELPRPRGWEGSQGNGFLFEWFSIFSDLFAAHRGGGKQNGSVNPAAAQYLLHEKNNQRLRESIQNQNMNRPGMNQAMMQRMNGAMNGNMQGKGVTPQQAAMMQQRKAMAMQQQQQMNREGAEGEINGVRPGTPAAGDDGGSPSKRPRIDNGQPAFNNGMMQNGRPGGVPGAQQQGMMIQAGFNPQMNPQFQRNGAMPPKGMQVSIVRDAIRGKADYDQGGMPNGMMNMGNGGSPMMQGMNQFPEGMQMDYMNQRNMAAGQPNMQQGGGAQSGNHALQDYQMQLMLLEQQNKKRLMMARQEQHENNPHAGGPMPGVNMPPAGMSPSGSRTGTSPNPGEMKRNPAIGGLPGSPSAGEAMAGRSPAAMNFMNNIPGQDFNAGMFMGKDGQMMGGPQGMRPPTSDMGAMRQQGGRPGQFSGGQPMQQQGSQAGQQMGTPGQREMPPPQAPAGGNNTRGNQGASPAANAPPTPSQSNKANPKTKKGAAKDDNKRQRPAKKGSAANAPTSDENPPATPTPSTPITPNNPGAMNQNNKGQPGLPQGNQVQNNQAMQMNQQMPQNDFGQLNFGETTGGADPQFNLDFSTLENADVLENFDFDSFLNTSADDTFNVDIGADFGEFGMGQDQ
ncbi:hypothetical protein OHC33_008497 [Knufia fluminis]|uniref:LisH domain-containing protein n=1 Tax=Knufia fluminis TaxID=191047 RepID=A0AAN8I3N1_9EURO|nr:hypothetical protein OHC33_008497 [Knufia fluminis]